MRQITITLIALLALTMGMASCSHESPVPFLEEMGVCTDSIMMDSFPKVFDYKTQGASLTKEQSDSLGLDYEDVSFVKIISAKKFGNDFLVTYCDHSRLYSILYSNDGKVLDRCYFIGRATIKEDPIKDKCVEMAIEGPDTIESYDFKWRNCYIGVNKLEAVGIHNADTLKYIYTIQNHRISRIRIASKPIYVASLDMLSLPVSQVDDACEMMKEPVYMRANCGHTFCEWLYSYQIAPFVKYNFRPILLWIANHRNENIRVILTMRLFFYGAYNHRVFMNVDYLKKQILQIKDKDAKQYLLRELVGTNGENMGLGLLGLQLCRLNKNITTHKNLNRQ